MLEPGKSAIQRGTQSLEPLLIECGPRTAYVHDDKARTLLRRAGVARYMKDPHRRGVWCCPISVLWDVIAVAEKVQRREVILVELAR